MARKPEPTRRQILMSAMTISAVTVAAGSAGAQPARSRVLVAYLSRSGNTRLIARQISRAVSGELFEIETAQAYPDDYEEMVAQAQREKEAGFEPQLRTNVANIAGYQTIYLGFPIWGMTAPSPVRSFLSSHDLSGKTIVPFITHGGYGQGDSIEIVRRHAPGSEIAGAFVLERPTERQTLAAVTKWLDTVN
jgi:flavodoxin